jgi:hypothetical protein
MREEKQDFYSEDELVLRLSKKIIDYIKEFRQTCQIDFGDNCQICQSPVFNGNDDMEKLRKEMLKGNIKSFKGDTFELKRCDFWGFQIISQIEMLAAIGGQELMNKVYQRLHEEFGNEDYNYTAVFNEFADGIAGWVRK